MDDKVWIFGILPIHIFNESDETWENVVHVL